MRMVLDTNVLVSALIPPGRLPEQLTQYWEAGEFTLVTSEAQLDEIQRVLGYEKLARFIRADQAARLIANLRQAAIVVTSLPSRIRVCRSDRQLDYRQCDCRQCESHVQRGPRALAVVATGRISVDRDFPRGG